MKNEICLARLKEIEVDYHKSYDALRIERSRKRASVLNQWAQENAHFVVGDIIQSYDTIICIDKIMGNCNYEKLYCVYYGPVLTKQLKPRKDGFHTEIYDDGRKVKLIKHK